jgi:hypothetical protein
MPRAIGAFASWLAASLVSLDQGATQNGSEWGQMTHQDTAAFAECSNGLFFYIHQTTYITGLIICHTNKRYSTFFTPPYQEFHKSN